MFCPCDFKKVKKNKYLINIHHFFLTTDLNRNVNKINSTTEHNNTVTFPYKTPQPSSNTQTNTLSSSHQNR